MRALLLAALGASVLAKDDRRYPSDPVTPVWNGKPSLSRSEVRASTEPSSSQALIEALGWSPSEKALTSPGGEKWTVLGLVALTLVFAFFVRWQYAVHPMRFVVEMVVTVSVVSVAFSEYLNIRSGPKYELVFLHCVGLEMLLGFDNVLDVVGWYAHAHLTYSQAASYILGGAFIQMLVRFPLFPLLVTSVAGNGTWNKSTAYLLILLSLRNLYLCFAAKSTSTSSSWSFQPTLSRFTAALGLPLRILLTESTALLCDVDAFIAKTLITDDAFAITASSILALCLLRAVALLLLLWVHEDIIPMYLMWGLSGSLMLTMAAHEIWPAVPPIPAVLRMMIPAVLYTYTVGVAVFLWRKHPRKGEIGVDSEASPDKVVPPTLRRRMTPAPAAG